MVIILEILFKNKTTYSKEAYDDFLFFHRKKFGNKYKIYNIFVIALILFCIVYLVGYRHYNSAIIFCLFLVGFIYWRFFKPIIDVSKEYKSDKICKSASFIFSFYEKFFTVESNNHISKIKYHNLYKIFETDSFFYLYVDKTHSFLLNKSTFTKGNCENFRIFISKVAKLKNCKSHINSSSEHK